MSKVVLGISGILIAVCAFIEYAYHEANKEISDRYNTTVIISDGDDIARKLGQVGLVTNVFIARGVLWYMKEFKGLQYHSGEYKIPKKHTLLAILDKFDKHEVMVHSINISRGSQLRRIKEKINARRDLLGELTVPIKEGDIIAGTYDFTYPTSKDELVSRMLKYSNEEIMKIWNSRAALCMAKSPQELKIFASIVAKESNYKSDEIKLIAGVLTNRLRINMPLQADSTLVYYRRMHDTNMTYREFMASHHPYNTYRTRGLTPEPISSPAHDELIAVANPVKTDYLYFQHDKTTGEAFFFKDFVDHLKTQREIMKRQGKGQNQLLK